MHETDYAELLSHTQAALRDAGMGEVVNQMMAVAEPVEPSMQLMQLLELAEAEMRLDDATTARAVADRLGSFVRTESGAPVRGLWLDLAPEHQDLFRLPGVDLTEAADVGPILRDLRRLRGELLEARER